MIFGLDIPICFSSLLYCSYCTSCTLIRLVLLYILVVLSTCCYVWRMLASVVDIIVVVVSSLSCSHLISIVDSVVDS